VVFPRLVEAMAEKEPGDETEGSELSETARQMRAAQPYIAAVWKLVGGAAVGVLGGYFLDKALGTAPWVMLGLSLVGISVGFYGFLHEMTRLGKKKR
jgi:ATP synthase protein I